MKILIQKYLSLMEPFTAQRLPVSFSRLVKHFGQAQYLGKYDGYL